MIQPSASTHAATLLATARQSDGARSAASGEQADFDAAIGAWLANASAGQALQSEVTLGVERPGTSTSEAGASHPGRTNAKASSKKAKAGDADSKGGEPLSIALDPRISPELTLQDAQQRLARSADVADRAAAELRGSVDRPSESLDEPAGKRAESQAPQARQRAEAQSTGATTGNPESAAASATSQTKDAPGAQARSSDVQSAQTSGPSHAGNQRGADQQRGDSRGSASNARAVTPARASAAELPGGAASAGSAAQGRATAQGPAASTSSGGVGAIGGLRDPLRSFTARGPAATAPGSPKAGTPEGVQTQLARGLVAAVRQRDGTLTLRLSPDSLGDLKIQVRVESGHVSARIDAQTDQARQLLTESTSTLRSALEAQGLVVERIEVAPAERAPTFDPAALHSMHAMDDRAQGGALSSPEQASPQGFGDGASADQGGTADQRHDHQGTFGANQPDDLIEPTAPSAQAFGTGDLWVLRVDLVA